MILLDWDILISFDFFLDWNHLDPLLWDDFLVVLDSLFDCVVIGLDNFARNSLNDFPFFISCDFLLDGHSLHILPVFVLYYLFLVGYIVDSALS